MTTFHKSGQLHPQSTPDERHKRVHEAACKYAGLRLDFDRFEEQYFTSKIVVYDAYIAGYVDALTS